MPGIVVRTGNKKAQAPSLQELTASWERDTSHRGPEYKWSKLRSLIRLGACYMYGAVENSGNTKKYMAYLLSGSLQ